MRKSRSAAKDFQEVYYLNTCEYDTTRPCLHVNSFCHSIFHPGFLCKKNGGKGRAYIAASLVLKGEYERKTQDGERMVFREGCFQLWNLNDTSETVSLPHTHLERYFILFRVNRLLLEILDELFPEGLPVFQAKDPSKLKKCFEEIRHILRKQGSTDELLLSAAGFRLLTEAADQLKREKAEKPPALLLALEYIHENFNNAALTREKIAENAGISTTLLGKYFTKYMKTSVNKYVTDFRIGKGGQLLLISDLSIGEIAEKCGFSYSYYFSKVFKKNTGFLPGKYKEKMKMQ